MALAMIIKQWEMFRKLPTIHQRFPTTVTPSNLSFSFLFQFLSIVSNCDLLCRGTLTLTRIRFVGDVGAIEAAPAVEEPLEVSPQRQYSLDDFELIRVIGRGSYAKVLMVELKRTRRIYAMKVIKKALVTDDEDIDWVQTEKHVFETASNHPFLVGLHSCFQTPSRLFFVIEFVRGGDLMFHMQRQRRLPEEHARFYAAEISLALNFLHEKVSFEFSRFQNGPTK